MQRYNFADDEERFKNKRDSNEAWGLENLCKICYQAFVVPFFRLGKNSLSLNPNMTLPQILLDCFAIVVILTVFGLLNWWKPLGITIAVVTVPILFGFALRSLVKYWNNTKIQEPISEEYKVNPKVNFQQVVKNSIKNPTRKVVKDIPDFGEGDLQAFNEWIQDPKNRNRISSRRS